MLEDGGIFMFGPFRLVVARRELLAEGKPVPLGGRAFEVLLALVRRPGKLVSRDDLVAAAWHGAVVEENTVQAQLSVLRRALRDGNGNAHYIETVARRGYCFVAPVTWQAAEECASPDPSPSPAARGSTPGRSRRRFAVLALLLLLCVGVGLRWGMERRPPAPWSAEDRRMTFLLKPFTVAADAPELRGYAEALTRSVVSRMRYTDLSVQFAPPGDPPINGAATPVQAKFIYEGSVDMHDGVPRATVVVRDAATGRVLKTIAVDDPPTEANLSSRLAVMGMAAVALWAGQTEELRRSAALPEDRRDARDWVILANAETEIGREGNERAIAKLEHARAAAPDDFHVLGPYAVALATRANNGWSADAAADLAASQAAAERTFAMAPRGQHAFPALCLVALTRGRWEDALVAADRMLLISPHNGWALHTKAVSLLALGRVREAEAVLPVWLAGEEGADVYAGAGLIHFAGGRYEESAHWLRNAILTTPAEDLRRPAFAGIRLYLASAEAHLGHAEAAAQALRDFAAAVPEVHGIAEFQRWNDPVRFFLAAPDQLVAGLRLAGMAE
jgi:DNA-binding winged helix-turn-helix (wHTH) protein/tetratricopeptide (TPR) repeat protein